MTLKQLGHYTSLNHNIYVADLTPLDVDHTAHAGHSIVRPQRYSVNKGDTPTLGSPHIIKLAFNKYYKFQHKKIIPYFNNMIPFFLCIDYQRRRTRRTLTSKLSDMGVPWGYLVFLSNTFWSHRGFNFFMNFVLTNIIVFGSPEK